MSSIMLLPKVLLACASWTATMPALKVGPTSLGDLTEGADIIVIGEVLAVHTEQLGSPSASVRIADIRVAKTLKGPDDVHAVSYVAQGIWTCDITGGEVGERGVYFLLDKHESAQSRPIYRVAHSGRGRMPLRAIEAKEFATVWTCDVYLPQGLDTGQGPQPEYSFIQSVPLPALEDAIGMYASVQGRPLVGALAFPRRGSDSGFWLVVGEDGACLRTRYVPTDSNRLLRYGAHDRLFKIDDSARKALVLRLSEWSAKELPVRVGADLPAGAQRCVSVWVEGKPRETWIGSIDDAWMGDADRASAARRALRLWGHLRSLIDSPELADWRSDDSRWLTENR